jgi:hypothetical protein
MLLINLVSKGTHFKTFLSVRPGKLQLFLSQTQRWHCWHGVKQTDFAQAEAQDQAQDQTCQAHQTCQAYQG